ncbi:MAG: hypothetical protein OXI67_15570 [Candidatus Poribacteria bacterium]|nr:hypothetical protein [Candidatus Poribacteria bacterium]
MQRIKSFPLKLMFTFLILPFCVAGCSDTPYIGSTDSMLTPDDIDNYLFSPDGETLCLQSGYDSICLTLYPKGKDSTAPIVHIYPSRIRYVFSYEGKTILQAEKIRDNIDIITSVPPRDGGPVSIIDTTGDGGTPPNTGGTPPNTGGTPPNTGGTPPNTGGTPPNTGGTPPNTGGTPPNTGGTPSDDDSPPNNIVSHYVFSNPPNNLLGDEWIVWIYYPDDYSGPRGLPNSPEGYGFTIKVNGGETTEFAQVTGGERGSGVRLVIRTDQLETYITITWNPPYTDRSATFTLKSDIDLKDYDL